MAEKSDIRQRRLSILRTFGASADEANELVATDRSGLVPSPSMVSRENLQDELFVARWREYCHDVADAGSLAPLTKYLIQLHFPVKEQISQTPDYINATTRGERPCGVPAFHHQLKKAERSRLLLHETMAGAIPVIVFQQQKTFQEFVCALAHRNEPVAIPDSMGAILITKLNNWDRVELHRRAHIQSGGTRTEWKALFHTWKSHKELYQDSLIVVREGNYSGLPAAAVSLEDQVWHDLSLAIRLEHECVHYVFSRFFHLVKFGLIDELLADYLSVVRVCGNLPKGWLSLFLGIEDERSFRSGGRLENYRHPCEEIFVLQQRLCRAAIHNLQAFHDSYILRSESIDRQRDLILSLAPLSLEELAGMEARMLPFPVFSSVALGGT